MNVEIGTVAAQFSFLGIFVSNFCYWFFAVDGYFHRKRHNPKLPSESPPMKCTLGTRHLKKLTIEREGNYTFNSNKLLKMLETSIVLTNSVLI
jgi:hypothetical protein